MSDRNESTAPNEAASAAGGRRARFAANGGVVAIVAAVATLGVPVVTIGVMILNAIEQIGAR